MYIYAFDEPNGPYKFSKKVSPFFVNLDEAENHAHKVLKTLGFVFVSESDGADYFVKENYSEWEKTQAKLGHPVMVHWYEPKGHLGEDMDLIVDFYKLMAK